MGDESFPVRSKRSVRRALAQLSSQAVLVVDTIATGAAEPVAPLEREKDAFSNLREQRAGGTRYHGVPFVHCHIGFCVEEMVSVCLSPCLERLITGQ